MIFTVVTSASFVMVKKINFDMKQQQQVQDCLLFPFPSIGSTSSAYFTEPKWSAVWCVELTWFIDPCNEGL